MTVRNACWTSSDGARLVDIEGEAAAPLAVEGEQRLLVQQIVDVNEYLHLARETQPGAEIDDLIFANGMASAIA